MLKQTMDFGSDLSRFSLLKTLQIIADLIHMDELDLVYWHAINLQMLEQGLWSKFSFKPEIEVKHELSLQKIPTFSKKNKRTSKATAKSESDEGSGCEVEP